MTDITVGDANDFAENIPGALASRRQFISKTKQFLNDAIDREMIKVNPFAKLTGARVANPDRAFFVKREMVERVMECCLSDKMRLIVALSRYGGLRSPTEVNALQWVDVDCGHKRIVIRKHKTKRREIPLFPELLPMLESAFENAPEGARYVIDSQSLSYYNQLELALRKTGLDVWPRLWDNMRSTRQTELEASHPTHVVCKWLGNSAETAKAHYLQVTDDDFEKANAPPGAPRQAVENPGRDGGQNIKT